MSIKIKPKAISIIIQILVWTGVLLLPLIFVPHPPPHHQPKPEGPHYFEIISNFTLLIVFYYLNYYLLIPKLYLKRKTTTYIFSVIGSLVIITLISHIINYSFNIQYVDKFRPRPLLFGPSILFFIVVLFVSLGLRINAEWKRAEKEKIKIEKEKLNAELSYLKAQVNPHFLFNTLNIIYTLATMKSDQTAEAVMKLSKLMRYVIIDVQEQFVPIEKEIGYIENFIELHRLRLAKNNQINVHISGNQEGLQISPFILIPFVENAFKHGTSAIEPMIIDITIALTNNELHFSIKNDKLNINQQSYDSTGVGNENTMKRLELIYKKNYTLQITETDKTFEVELNIVLI
jgi:two-component system LytT family sensor kinase